MEMENPLSEAAVEKKARRAAEKVLDFMKDVSTLAQNMKILADEAKDEISMAGVGVVLCVCVRDKPEVYMHLGTESGIKGCARHINESAAELQERKNG